MTVAIFGIGESATRASLGGVPGIDLNYFEAQVLGLVMEKAFKLEERPTIEIGSLGLAEPSPIADAVELLNCNRWIAGSLSKFNDSLADDMIGIAGKALLSTGQPFLRTTDAPGALLCLLPLEIGADLRISIADMLDLTPAEEAGLPAIGRDGNVIDAPVNTNDCVVGLLDRRCFLFEGDREIHLPLADEQSGISQLPILEIFRELGSTMISNLFNTAIKGPYAQAGRSERKVPSSNAPLEHDGIVGEMNGPCWESLSRAQGSIFAGNMPDGADRHLSREAEVRADGFIGQALQADRVGDTSLLEGDLRGIVASIRPCLDGMDGNIEGKIYF